MVTLQRPKRPPGYVHDDKSLCTDCNTYNVGRHKPYCKYAPEPHDEHYRNPTEQAIRSEIQAELKERMPEGTRAEVTSIGGYVDVRILCGGCVPITCYYCCMSPGHEGQCYSSNKNIHFNPEHY